MRTTFTIEIKADVHEDDIQARQLFKELLRDNAQALYSQVSVISRRPPTIKVTVEDEEQGTVHVPLFAGGEWGETFMEDYS